MNIGFLVQKLKWGGSTEAHSCFHYDERLVGWKSDSNCNHIWYCVW